MKLTKELLAVSQVANNSAVTESQIAQYNALMSEGKTIEAGQLLAGLLSESPEDELLAYFRKGHRAAIGSVGDGNMDEHGRATIDRMFERFRGYLKDGDLSGFMKAYADEGANHPDAFDYLIDEVLEQAGVEDIDALFKKAGIRESARTVATLIAEGSINGFTPPFSVSGNWVNDARGRGICEMGESREALKEIAKALNAWTAMKESEMSEADKHSFIGKLQRLQQLKKKVDTSWDDAVAAEKQGDKKSADRAFNKHVRYANLERPGTWSTVKEAHENLKAVAATAGRTSATRLSIGDAVEVTGNVQYKGEVGTIDSFHPNDEDRKFVLVVLNSDDKAHSFHISDVTGVEEEDYMHDDAEPTSRQQTVPDVFYIAFYSHAEERPWIGMVTKKGGGMWHEKRHKGQPSGKWGHTFELRYTPDDIVEMIEKSYPREDKVEGPFFDAADAEAHVKDWGKLQESVQTREMTIKGIMDQIKKRSNDTPDSKVEPSALDVEAQPFKPALEVTQAKGSVTLNVNGKKAATFDIEQWKHFIDLIDNRTEGRVGQHQLAMHHEGDGIVLIHRTGTRISIPPHEVAGIKAVEVQEAECSPVAKRFKTKLLKKVDESITFTDFDDWKQAVLNSYPQQAKKIKFKGRFEAGKHTISAEVPGEDRSYGVWDGEKENGVVLSEDGMVADLIKGAKRWVKDKPHKDVVAARHLGKALGHFNQAKDAAEKGNRDAAEQEAAKAEKEKSRYLKVRDLKDPKVQAYRAAEKEKMQALQKQVAEAAFKVNDKVTIIKGPADVRGKTGHIGEIRTDVQGKKRYTIDYDVGGRTASVMLDASDIKRLSEAATHVGKGSALIYNGHGDFTAHINGEEFSVHCPYDLKGDHGDDAEWSGKLVVKNKDGARLGFNDPAYKAVDGLLDTVDVQVLVQLDKE